MIYKGESISQPPRTPDILPVCITFSLLSSRVKLNPSSDNEYTLESPAFLNVIELVESEILSILVELVSVTLFQ